MVSFIGNSGSGKTTFVEKIVPELRRNGYRVAVLKHTPHGFDIDKKGKDTSRLTEAGSDVVAISSSEKLTVIKQLDKELTLSQIKSMVGRDVDVLLVEGYKNGHCDKILIADSHRNEEQTPFAGELIAVVEPYPSVDGGLDFHHLDVVTVVSLIIEKIIHLHNGLQCNLIETKRILPAVNHQNENIETLLSESVALHGHICSGQVLGLRMALRGLQELNMDYPLTESMRLAVYVEIDRCAADAIQVATKCSLGKRTMKYVDYGKLAATFVDLQTANAVRLSLQGDAHREASLDCAKGLTKYEAQVSAYMVISDEELFKIERGLVEIPVEDMPGPPQRRVVCDECGEEVNDARDVKLGIRTLCRACAFGSYYRCHNELGKVHKDSVYCHNNKHGINRLSQTKTR